MKLWVILAIVSVVLLLSVGGIFYAKNFAKAADATEAKAIASGATCGCGADCGCGCKGQCGTGSENSCGCLATGGKCSAAKS